MKTLKRILVVACMLAALAVAFGCSEEGPMEKAGKKIDKAAEDAKETAKKIFE